MKGQTAGTEVGSGAAGWGALMTVGLASALCKPQPAFRSKEPGGTWAAVLRGGGVQGAPREASWSFGLGHMKPGRRGGKSFAGV